MFNLIPEPLNPQLITRRCVHILSPFLCAYIYIYLSIYLVLKILTTPVELRSLNDYGSLGLLPQAP